MKPLPRRRETASRVGCAHRDHQRRRLVLPPDSLELESRRLLSGVTASVIGYDGTDLTGPTAATGPDGIQDLHIQIQNLPVSGFVSNTTVPQPTIINQLSVTGPSGFSWSYATVGTNNPNAGPSVQVVREPLDASSTSETVDVYINPIVQVVNPTTGQTSTATLPSNSALNLSVSYKTDNNGDALQTFTSPTLSSGASGLTLADPSSPLPALGLGAYPATFGVQTTDTTDTHPSGDATVTIGNLPTGSTISSATLSDVAGLHVSIGNGYGRPELGIYYKINYLDSPSGTTAVLSFPPLRDEAGTTMTLAFQLAGDSTQYVSDFAVPAADHTDVNLRDQQSAIPAGATFLDVSPTTTPDMVSYVDPTGHTQVVTFQALLDMAEPGSSPRYTEFNLTDGTTGGLYQLSTDLVIQSGLILQGADSNVDLQFTFASTVPVDGQNYGAINLRSSHVTIQNLKINFSQADVDLSGGQSAIIDAQNVSQVPLVDVNLESLTITAAFDSQYFNDADQTGGPSQLQDTMQTIHMGDHDSGVISDNTIQGGTTTLQFGPWLVDHNTYTGAVDGTICDGVFSLNGAHDVTIQDSVVTNASLPSNGYVDRFFAANNGGYGIELLNNSVSDDVGLIAPKPNGSQAGNPRNNTEEILAEVYGVYFEGSTSAVTISSGAGSYDRRLVAIPAASMLAGADVGTLFILDGPFANTAILAPQVFTSSDGSTVYFLLSSSLPQGTFDFAIEPCYTNFNVSGNLIDTSNTISTALVLSSTFDNVQVVGNTFKGDQSSETTGYGVDSSQAIRIAVSQAKSNGNINGDFVSHNPMFDVNIQDNLIEGPIGGIQLYTTIDLGGAVTSYGRTYAYVNLSSNKFVYTYANTDIIQAGRPGEYSSTVDGTVVDDPTAPYFVDPREISLTTSGNTIQWLGIAPPSADVQISTADVNGTLYQGPTATTNPSPALLSIVAAIQVDLSAPGSGNNNSEAFNQVGTSADGSGATANFDGAGNSYSANLLTNSIVWDGQSFNLGAAGVNNVVRLGGVPIYPPQGQYSDLLLLGSSYFGSHPVTFTLYYTTGQPTTYTQVFSDWQAGYNGPGTTAPGESIARESSYLNTTSGQSQMPNYLYGYDIPVDPTRTLQAIADTNDNRVNILAADLVISPSLSTTQAVSDPGFEAVSVGAGNYAYNPSGSAWTFSGSPGNGSGVTGNNSPFTSGNPNAPQGTQVAFLQANGTITQTISGWAAGNYTISFEAAQRGNHGTSVEDFEVLVDGVVVGTFLPSGTSYQTYTTGTFTISSGSHTVEFLGLDSAGGDNTAFLDAVTVSVSTSASAPSAPTPGDSGFESIPIGPGTYAYNPTGSAWTFSGSTGNGSGVTGNNSPFTSGNPVAPQGNQVAFLQANGTITQSLAGWAAGNYTISFDAARRGNHGGLENFEILIDGKVVGTFAPISTAYQAFQTSTFTVSAGSHTVEFLGLDSAGGDNTDFLDSVSIATA